jgi:hypothetical protein
MRKKKFTLNEFIIFHAHNKKMNGPLNELLSLKPEKIILVSIYESHSFDKLPHAPAIMLWSELYINSFQF